MLLADVINAEEKEKRTVPNGEIIYKGTRKGNKSGPKCPIQAHENDLLSAALPACRVRDVDRIQTGKTKEQLINELVELRQQRR